MTEPSKPKDTDEVCLMCKRPKSKHTQEELQVCSRKMMEFKKNKTGGAGIEWNFTIIDFLGNHSKIISGNLYRITKNPFLWKTEVSKFSFSNLFWQL